MKNNTARNNKREDQMEQIIGLLKLAIKLDDKEITTSTLEAVIEMLQEMDA